MDACKDERDIFFHKNIQVKNILPSNIPARLKVRGPCHPQPCSRDVSSRMVKMRFELSTLKLKVQCSTHYAHVNEFVQITECKDKLYNRLCNNNNNMFKHTDQIS